MSLAVLGCATLPIGLPFKTHLRMPHVVELAILLRFLHKQGVADSKAAAVVVQDLQRHVYHIALPAWRQKIRRLQQQLWRPVAATERSMLRGGGGRSGHRGTAWIKTTQLSVYMCCARVVCVRVCVCEREREEG